jgi:NADPH-dependent curcumin reductase CurA
VVIQLAKLRGMKVIASAGNDKKVEYCRSIGADYAFNYKKESYKDALAKQGPIDVYYVRISSVTNEKG